MDSRTTWSTNPEGNEEQLEGCDSDSDNIIRNINLNSASNKSAECSGIDIDQTIRQDSTFMSAEYNEDDNGYTLHSNNRNKNKRPLENTSPEEATSSKVFKQQTTDTSKFVNTIFLKGLNGLQSKQNPLKIKKALLGIDNTLKDDQIKYSKENIKINCRDESKKAKFTYVQGIRN